MPNPKKSREKIPPDKGVRGLFRNKYRTTSHRLTGFDYASDGAYFITIVTKNREHFFGKIIDNKMVLNELGKIAENFWREIPRHFPYARLDEFVIMPNHMHGILWIDNDKNNNNNAAARVETPNLGVSTKKRNEKNNNKPRNKNHKPEWKPGTIGVIINQYKRICTINSRQITPDFAWQRNYHDRIIRNDDELNRIREYIIYNPQMWERDRNNQGLWL